MFGFSSRFSKIWSSFDSQNPNPTNMETPADEEPRTHRLPSLSSIFGNISSHSPLANRHSSPTPVSYHHHFGSRNSPRHHSTPHSSPHHPLTSSSSRYIDSHSSAMETQPKRQLPSTSGSPLHHRNISNMSNMSSNRVPSPFCEIPFHLSDNSDTSSIRKVHLIKTTENSPDAGLTVCGGLEVGLQGTIYISRVAEHSLAEKHGLCPGDQILAANYTSFLDPSITCQQAMHIICSDNCLTLSVLPRRDALSSQRRHHTYAWVDPDGRPVSPPPPDRDMTDTDIDPMLSMRGSRRRKSSTSPDIRSIKITMERGISLGLMIRGGLEYGLGIYVTGIDSDTLAEKAGLKVGDQLLTVNNYNFQNVLHDEAVDILRSSARLTMKVRYVGKVPASTAPLAKDLSVGTSGSHKNHRETSEASSSPPPSHASTTSSSGVYHFTQIPSSRCSTRDVRRRQQQSAIAAASGKSSPLRRSGNEQTGSNGSPKHRNGQTQHVTPKLMVTDSGDEEMLEHKLQEYLTESERITFAFYRNEYVTKGMTIDAFIAVLLELLDTNEKYSIMNLIRGFIRNEDIDKFDELIYKREEQAMIKSKANASDKPIFITTTEDSSDSSVCYQPTDGNEEDDEDSCENQNVHAKHLTRSQSKRHLPDVPIADDRVYSNSNDLNLNSFRNTRRLSRSDAGDRRDSHSLSPTRGLFRKMVPRRHSSCNTETKPISNEGQLLTVGNPDERRWSIAAAHDVPANCENYNCADIRAARSLSNEIPLCTGSGREMRSGSGNHLQIPSADGYVDHQNLPSPPHLRVRRHRSLPSPTFASQTPQQLSITQQHHRSSSFRMPHRRATQEPGGRLRVTVKKTKPILGIAIEGGINVVNQKQPRIISIHNSGAAFDTGDLHVGHIILEVDNISTANLTHDQVAQLIADAYYNTPHKHFIEFLVREKSKHEFDIRRSSFMLLHNSFE